MFILISLLLIVITVCRSSAPKYKKAVLGIDLGNDFLKIGLIMQGSAVMDIVTDFHSKRKTRNLVSFQDKVRKFGDDAISHLAKNPESVPIHYINRYFAKYPENSLVGEAVTFANITVKDHAVPFDFIYATIVDYCRKIAANYMITATDFRTSKNTLTTEDPVDLNFNISNIITEAVVTIPADTTFVQKDTIINACHIAGIKKVSLVSETPAAMIRRTLDLKGNLGKAEDSLPDLVVNFGASKVEMCIIKSFTQAYQAIPSVQVFACVTNFGIGGSKIDAQLAKYAENQFAKQYPEVNLTKRARARILKSANDVKHVLSANRVAVYSVESLQNDIDFRIKEGIPRFVVDDIVTEEFSSELKEDFAKLLIKYARSVGGSKGEFVSNLEHIDSKSFLTKYLAEYTIDKEFNSIEYIGGSWRVPKISEIMQEIFSLGGVPVLTPTQRMNGEEMIGLGAVYASANNSASFKIKQVNLYEPFNRNYSMDIIVKDGGSEQSAWKSRTSQIIYAAGNLVTNAIGAKKNVRLPLRHPLTVDLDREYVVGLVENTSPEFNTVVQTWRLDKAKMLEVKKQLESYEEKYRLDNNDSALMITEVANLTMVLKSVTNVNGLPEIQGVDVLLERFTNVTKEVKRLLNESSSDSSSNVTEISTNSTDDTNAEADRDPANATNSTNSSVNETKPKYFYENVTKLERKKQSFLIPIHVVADRWIMEEVGTILTAKKKTYFYRPMSGTESNQWSHTLSAANDFEYLHQKIANIRNEIEGRSYRIRELFEDERQIEASQLSAESSIDDLVWAASTESERSGLRSLSVTAVEWLDSHEWEKDIDDDDEAVRFMQAEMKLHNEELLKVSATFDQINRRISEWKARKDADLLYVARNTSARVQEILLDCRENRTWIGEDKIGEIESLAKSFVSHLEESVEKQAAIPLNQDPVFIVADLLKQSKSVLKEAGKLLKLNKPLEKKKDDSASSDEKGSDDAKTSSDSEKDSGDGEKNNVDDAKKDFVGKESSDGPKVDPSSHYKVDPSFEDFLEKMKNTDPSKLDDLIKDMGGASFDDFKKNMDNTNAEL